jgi:hypothetical protein
MDAAIIEPNPKIRLRLIPAPDDLPLSSREYQKELADFAKSLREQGIQFSDRAFAFDALDAAGGQSGEFTLVVTTIASFITGAAAVTGAWLHAKGGRKVHVKYGDVEADAPTVKELEKALRLVEESLKRIRQR